MNHMTKGLEDKKSEELNRWVASFINNVMLVYYGFYKWDKLRGDFYQVIDLEKAQFGKKLPDQYEANLEEFSKFIDIKNNLVFLFIVPNMMTAVIKHFACYLA